MDVIFLHVNICHFYFIEEKSKTLYNIIQKSIKIDLPCF